MPVNVQNINMEELQLELLDKVVRCLLEMVKTPESLHVAKFPTGLDEKLKDFEDTVLFLLQQHQSGRPQILGIWGLGGVGKTTLAKEFFNRKNSDYCLSCFLSDIRDNANKGSLMSLQRKLLNSLSTRMDKSIDTVDEGTGMLAKYMEYLKSSNASLQREHIQSLPKDCVDEGKGMHIKPLKSGHALPSKVLVILDDVDHVDQVDALLPVDLPSGSLILITSRDRRILVGSKVPESSIYRLSGLNNQYSRELFCSYAFNQIYPLPQFESLVEKFLKACNGLPLSLKVLGAQLYERNRSYWEDELGRLEQILPSEIKKRLKISFEALDKEEKQMFLDIACFLIGQRRDTAIRIWDASGWKGRLGFQNLQDRCLVEVDKSNLINLHDHLRDLGRDVAEESWQAGPLRLWRWTQNVIDYFSQQSSVIPVRGIKLDLSDYNEDDEDGDVLCMMRRLPIVHSEGFILERILKSVKSPNILWIRWKDCPYFSLPSWIPMKNLRILHVSGSILSTLWQREGESQAPLQLPVCLEEFWADGCVQLKSIQGLEQLTKLRRLLVEGCLKLEELPSMETLTSLELLWAKGCVKLKSIRGLEHATKLQFLDVSGCSDLEELPSMETLTSLEGLWADGCVKLKSIRGLEHATKLQFLNVSRCSDLEELPSMETLTSLEQLWADGCVKLKSIRGLEHATKLQFLDVSGCSDLEELPSMETLTSLEGLWADGCVKLKSIRGSEHATKLQFLNVSRCSDLEELSSMETLTSLEQLWADGCVKLKSIRGSEHATKLQFLDVSGCSDLEELPSMETLTSLEGLWADGCVKLKSIRGLEHATKLQCLNVSRCSDLEEPPSMETLTSLEGLWADGCVKLKSIRGLEHAAKLQSLSVWGCSDLEELPSMETLTSLEQLWADRCVKLKSIRGLEHATKLQSLSVKGCSDLEELPSMERLTSLEKLSAEACVKLKSIRGLGKLTKLRKLSVGDCWELEEVEGVEHLTWLEYLDVSRCLNLQCPV